MPNWEELVRERLGWRLKDAAMTDDVVRELAHHLDDVFERVHQSGFSEDDAARCAWNEVKNWRRLAREINRAQGGIQMLKGRIQRLWLPAMVPAALAMAVLVTFANVTYKLRLYSIRPTLPAMFYYGSLLVLPAFGALSAYWSRRAGGSVANRVVASLFLPGAMFAAFLILLAAQLVLLPFGLGDFHRGDVPITSVFIEMGRVSLNIFILPAVLLLAGAAPFLHERPAKSLRASA
jgi:hypothetical protein